MANKILKTFSTTTKALDREAGIYEVMVSTESVDRDGDIIRAAGCKYADYMKNPVVLLGHDYHSLPVAKTLSINPVPGVGIKARFQFPKRGIHDEADRVRDLWEEGFINAASIGFIPLKSVNLNPNEPWGPKEFIEWELLEWSIVTVPANAEALRLAMKQARVTGSTRVEDLPPSVIRALGDLVAQLESQVKHQKHERLMARIRARQILRGMFQTIIIREKIRRVYPSMDSIEWDQKMAKRRVDDMNQRAKDHRVSISMFSR